MFEAAFLVLVGLLLSGLLARGVSGWVGGWTGRALLAFAGCALLVVGAGILGWGVRTLLVLVVGVGDEYRDSPPQAFIPFVVFCLAAGVFVGFSGLGILRRGRHHG